MTATTTTTGGSMPRHDHDRDYTDLLGAVSAAFEQRVRTAGAQLFRTSAAGLFELYLTLLPADRQVHNCHACRRFIETYGGLVTIDDDGLPRSAFWGDAPEFYSTAFLGMQGTVETSKVLGPFWSKEPVWGTPHTGDWTHMAVIPTTTMLHNRRDITPGQRMAASVQSFKDVRLALAEFGPVVLDEALRILKADAVARAEKFVSPVQWLRDLHNRPKGPRGDNVLWRAIAKAPEGYLHPRAAVTGSLLEDILAGLPMADIQRKFASKMHPLQYQRPQAAPSAGNVQAAEALVEKMGIARSLERRFARIDDVNLIWSPTPPKAPPTKGGVFGHLKTREAPPEVTQATLPVQTMTWEKFKRLVLPDAQEILFLTPGAGNYVGLTAPVHADAPPILKWDAEDERYPVAWYIYAGGSTPGRWNLSSNAYVRVTGITPLPCVAGARKMPFEGEGDILILDGAVDTQNTTLSLFPECMRQELHPARATIEAHSKSRALDGRDEASACGYDLRKGNTTASLRVFINGGWANYRIDRWD